jgi:CubicO group peptidase (beta-lactamase class C family)
MGTSGIIRERLDDLADRARREVDEGRLPACQFAVGFEGEIVAHEAFGDCRTADRTLVFSATKGFVAGVVWQLVGEGRLRLEDRVVEHFPAFGENGKAVVTIEQLLTHTAGFPRAPMRLDVAADPDRRRARMASWRLDWEPGSRFEYHPSSAHWVLGEVTEAIEGRSIGESVAARISDQLGLSFRLGVPEPEQGDILDLVMSGTEPTAAELEAVFGVGTYDRGEVTPEALGELGTPAGLALGMPGGGGVGTAADLAAYYQALLHDPDGLWDRAVRADGTGHIRCTLPDPLLGHASNRSAGLIIAGDDGRAFLRGMGHTVGPSTFGHNGASGQIAWADPDSGVSFGYVTNGIDRNFLAEFRRTSGLGSRAGLLTTPPD